MITVIIQALRYLLWYLCLGPCLSCNWPGTQRSYCFCNDDEGSLFFEIGKITPGNHYDITHEMIVDHINAKFLQSINIISIVSPNIKYQSSKACIVINCIQMIILTIMITRLWHHRRSPSVPQAYLLAFRACLAYLQELHPSSPSPFSWLRWQRHQCAGVSRWLRWKSWSLGSWLQ